MQQRLLVGMIPTLWLGLCLLGCADRVGSESRPIVRGQPTTDYPATVFLWLGGGSCSGTLVSPRTVLTAEHCLGGSVSSLEAFFGSDVDAQGTWIQAVDYDTHPSVDIGMITLAEPGPTTPILINTEDLAGHIGEAVTIVGFGVTSENGSDSGLKRVGQTPLDSVDTEIMWSGVEGSATCYGDSGGPNFMQIGGQMTVVGVTSFGTSICGEPYDGAVRVDSYADWISAYIDGVDPDWPPEDPPDPQDPPDAGPPDGEADASTPPVDPPGGDAGEGGGGVDGDVSGGCSAGGGGSVLALLLATGGLSLRRRRTGCRAAAGRPRPSRAPARRWPCRGR